MEKQGPFRITDLQAGDLLTIAGTSARFIYIGRMDHPLYPTLQLVIWWQWNRGYVLDAISAGQELPYPQLFRYDQESDTKALLKLALLTWQQSGGSLR